MSDTTDPAAPAPPGDRRPSRRRWLRWVLIGLAVLVLLPLAGAAAFLLTFDPSAYRPRIEAAVRQATGRDLTLAGPVEAKLSLVPTVALTDVTLANPSGQGFSRPAMVTARRVEVELALLPLLSRQVEVRRVLVDGVDLLLERTAQGAVNWNFAPPDRGEAAPRPPGAGQPAPAEPRGSISLHRLVLSQGKVTWRDGAAPPETLEIRRLAATSDGAGTPMRLEGEVVARGLSLALKAETGPLADLLAPAAAPPARPWPLSLAMAADGDAARLTLEGTVANPARGEGYRLALTAALPDLARLARVLPDTPLPPLRGVTLAARLGQDASGAPALSEIRAEVGESDLNALVPGLRLLRLTATLPRPEDPMALEVQARSGAVPVALQGSLGSPLRFVTGGAGGGPFPLDLRATAGESSLTARGGIADPRALTGVDLAVAARVPDLAALGPLLGGGGAALPPLRDIQAQARLAERGPGFAAGAVLRDLSLASSAGDLAGSLTYVIGTRPGLAGQLASRRLDLDALTAPAQARPQAPAAGAAPAAPAPPPAPVPAPAAAPPRRDGRLIPDLPLPLAPLRQTDSDLRLTVADLRFGGRSWRELEAHAVIQDGKARFDPVSATLPNGAGRVTLRAGADVTLDPPVVQLAARSDALDLAPLQAAFGMAARVTGRLGLDADLRGRGRDLRAVAATAHGHLGLALTGGQVPAGTLESLGAALRNQVPGIEQITGRPLDLSCVALRLNAQEGIARPGVILAEGGLGRIGGGEGAGAISLRDETLALRLNADLRLPVPGLGSGGLRMRAPVPVTGTLSNPRPEWNALVGAALAGEVANQAERLGGSGGAVAGQILGALGGALAGAGGGGGGGRDAAAGPIPDCGPALAMARGGRPGPVPPPAAAPAQAAPGPTQAPQQQRPSPPTSPMPLPRDIPAPAQDLLRRLPLPGFSR